MISKGVVSTAVKPPANPPASRCTVVGIDHSSCGFAFKSVRRDVSYRTKYNPKNEDMETKLAV